MSKIKELFGLYCNDTADFTYALVTQMCPYSHKKCYKTRKSDSNTCNRNMHCCLSK